MWRSRHKPFKISFRNLNRRVRCEHCWKKLWCMMCVGELAYREGRRKWGVRMPPIKTRVELSKHFLPGAVRLLIIYWSAQFTRWWMRKCAAAAAIQLVNSRSIGPADEKCTRLFFTGARAREGNKNALFVERVSIKRLRRWNIFTAAAGRARRCLRERGLFSDRECWISQFMMGWCAIHYIYARRLHA